MSPTIYCVAPTELKPGSLVREENLQTEIYHGSGDQVSEAE